MCLSYISLLSIKLISKPPDRGSKYGYNYNHNNTGKNNNIIVVLIIIMTTIITIIVDIFGRL